MFNEQKRFKKKKQRAYYDMKNNSEMVLLIMILTCESVFCTEVFLNRCNGHFRTLLSTTYLSVISSGNLLLRREKYREC